MAVVLSSLVTSFFSMFAFGESVGWGWEGVGHFLQLVPVLGVALLAIAVPWTGALIGLLGLFAAFRLGGVGLALGGLLVLAGAGFCFGRPRPRRLAYSVAVGAPLVVGILTAIIVLIVGPTPEG